MRIGWFAALLCGCTSAGAMTWSDLWLRRDQQAQQALEAGQPAQAARLFDDPQHRGYAEIQAKHYAEAAKQLAPLADPQSQYNRGNALAHSGELRAALDAYDAALKRAPPGSALSRDAQHNRDLVARRLQQQAGKGGQQSSGSQQQAGNDQLQSPSAGQPSSPQAPSQAPSDRPAQASAQPSSQGPAQDSAQPQGQQAAGAAAAAEEARRAERDAAAAVQQTQRQPADHSTANGPAAGADAADRLPADAARQPNPGVPAQPPTEQTMALDQWLRWIPDDPGGLLRRKFLIEHMMKQQEAQP